MGIPVLVHESNAYPGVTVKMLAKVASAVMLCDESAKKYLPEGCRTVVTGNPLRPAFRRWTRRPGNAPDEELGVDEPSADSVLRRQPGGGADQRRHGRRAGPEPSPGKASAYPRHRQGGLGGLPRPDWRSGAFLLTNDGIHVREYIDDMPRCMAAADLVICRCGRHDPQRAARRRESPPS